MGGSKKAKIPYAIYKWSLRCLNGSTKFVWFLKTKEFPIEGFLREVLLKTKEFTIDGVKLKTGNELDLIKCFVSPLSRI